MTGPEIMAVVGFIVMLFGAAMGAFWRMWGLIKEEGKKGDKALVDLAEFKLRVAETYVTRAGMQEQTSQIMKAIESVAYRIDGLTERIDNIMASRTPRSRS